MKIGLIHIILIVSLLAFVGCDSPVEEVKDIEIELVEEIEGECFGNIDYLISTLNKEKAYSIEKFPFNLFGSYALIGETNKNNYGDFLGYEFVVVDSSFLKDFDSVQVLIGYEERNVILINDERKLLVKKIDNIFFSDTSKLDFIIDNLLVDYLRSEQGDGGDIFYTYLKKKYRITRSVYYDNRSEDEFYDTCSFIEVFDNKIVYEYINCNEEGGATKTIYIPKISTEKARVIMDVLFDLNPEKSTDTSVYYEGNVWMSDTENEPKGEGVGCYYEIEQTQTMTIIKNTYCGC
jgi:hypothetical protein